MVHEAYQTALSVFPDSRFLSSPDLCKVTHRCRRRVSNVLCTSVVEGGGGATINKTYREGGSDPRNLPSRNPRSLGRSV